MHITDLPPELWKAIASYLPQDAVCSLLSVSRMVSSSIHNADVALELADDRHPDSRGWEGIVSECTHVTMESVLFDEITTTLDNLRNVTHVSMYRMLGTYLEGDYEADVLLSDMFPNAVIWETDEAEWIPSSFKYRVVLRPVDGRLVDPPWFRSQDGQGCRCSELCIYGEDWEYYGPLFESCVRIKVVEIHCSEKLYLAPLCMLPEAGRLGCRTLKLVDCTHHMETVFLDDEDGVDLRDWFRQLHLVDTALDVLPTYPCDNMVLESSSPVYTRVLRRWMEQLHENRPVQYSVLKVLVRPNAGPPALVWWRNVLSAEVHAEHLYLGMFESEFDRRSIRTLQPLMTHIVELHLLNHIL